MAKRLTMAEIDAILTLHTTRHSNREIATLLGVNRETVGKYVAQAEARVGHVARVPGDYVDVSMCHRLARRLSVIEPDVETGRAESFEKPKPGLGNQPPEGRLLVCWQIEDADGVFLGDDQGVPLGYWERIPEG